MHPSFVQIYSLGFAGHEYRLIDILFRIQESDIMLHEQVRETR